MSRFRPYIATLMVAILIFTTGCGGKQIQVTNLPPNVSQAEVSNWYRATGAISVIADQTLILTDAAISLNREGVLKGAAYDAVLTTLGKVSQAGIHVRNVLYQQPEYFGTPAAQKIRPLFNAITDELQKANIEGLLGVASQETRAKISLALSLLKGAVNTFTALLSVLSAADDRSLEFQESMRVGWLMNPYEFDEVIYV